MAVLVAQGRSIKDAARVLVARSDFAAAGSATSATFFDDATHGFAAFGANVAVRFGSNIVGKVYQ